MSEGLAEFSPSSTAEFPQKFDSGWLLCFSLKLCLNSMPRCLNCSSAKGECGPIKLYFLA